MYLMYCYHRGPFEVVAAWSQALGKLEGREAGERAWISHQFA